VLKAIVYASPTRKSSSNEAVHAYCHQSFGRAGPIWYSEGMAGLGHYWAAGAPPCAPEPREITFLRENLPRAGRGPFAQAGTGRSWEILASRWALCHFLAHNPTTRPDFDRWAGGCWRART